MLAGSTNGWFVDRVGSGRGTLAADWPTSWAFLHHILLDNVKRQCLLSWHCEYCVDISVHNTCQYSAAGTCGCVGVCGGGGAAGGGGGVGLLLIVTQYQFILNMWHEYFEKIFTDILVTESDKVCVYFGFLIYI